jgi:hypothetical protein
MRAPPKQRTQTECGVIATLPPLDNYRAAIIRLLVQRGGCDEVTQVNAYVSMSG